jgi:hypothetical protein
VRWCATAASSDATQTAASLISSCPARPAPWAPLALLSPSKDPLARRAIKGLPATPERRVRWVHKARRATQETQGLKALLDSLDRRVPLVTLEWLANEARKDRKGLSDHPAPLALTELLALRDLRARRVVLDHRGRRVFPEQTASTAAPDPKGSPAHKGSRVTLEMRDLRAYPEAADRRASRATPENKGLREIPVQKVRRGQVFPRESS